jgi:hypothetical protein
MVVVLEFSFRKHSIYMSYLSLGVVVIIRVQAYTRNVNKGRRWARPTTANRKVCEFHFCESRKKNEHTFVRLLGQLYTHSTQIPDVTPIAAFAQM